MLLSTVSWLDQKEKIRELFCTVLYNILIFCHYKPGSGSGSRLAESRSASLVIYLVPVPYVNPKVMMFCNGYLEFFLIRIGFIRI